MDLQHLRAQFPHVAETLYLNHAATSPLSRRVVAAIDTFVAERHGRQIENYDSFQHTIAETRQQLGRVLGAPTEWVEYAPNTSYGLNLLVHGLDWKEGDRIAIPRCEFPANALPFRTLERRGVVIDWIPDEEGVISLEAIADALGPETRLLAISWVQFLSGYRIDVEAVGALCREREVLLSVDAIQGLGALPFEAERWGVDFVAAGSHKWMMGTQGLGVVCASPTMQEQIQPPAGWLQGPVDWEDLTSQELRYHDDARRYRLGTLNGIGISALHASTGLYLEAGRTWCGERVLRLSRYLAEGLAERGFTRYGSDAEAHRSGIVTVRVGDPEQAQRVLRERQIEAAVRDGLLRFAPTYYNTTGELDQVLAACEQIER